MAAQYPPHGSFLYERLEEGLAELEAQLQRHGGPVDALLGFSQARPHTHVQRGLLKTSDVLNPVYVQAMEKRLREQEIT
eukprot:COSAG03_NODE_619_length_6676_cov_2.320663_10_plen_78_part_01